MISFKCTNITDEMKDFWIGTIHYTNFRHGYYEILISSRSTITVFIGISQKGLFACIPDFNTGCYLGRLDNISYNTDKLNYAMKNLIDAKTVATALDVLKEQLTF